VFADSDESDEETTTDEGDWLVQFNGRASSSVGSSSDPLPVTGSRFWALANDDNSDEESVSVGELNAIDVVGIGPSNSKSSMAADAGRSEEKILL
jgi:hypothetical protein